MMKTAVAERDGLTGLVVVELWRPDNAGKLQLAHYEEAPNLVTQVGDQYYGERAAGIGSPPGQVTGMRLGTGNTAASKTGAGAAIVTYVSGSSIAITGGFPTSALSGASRRIQWQVLWSAGTATNAALAEVVITNESPLTNVAGTAANTISRFVFAATIDKQAGDALTVTWNHDLLGA